MNFQLQSSFSPTGDQPKAIRNLFDGLKHNLHHQVLLGVTGSGKTFTMANIIAQFQRPTLIISHNKTLAAQLYQEFRDFFPKNAVSFFVSYYDYYQPEAYIPQIDTYISKETDINEEIDKLRLSATTNLLTRKDTIIVASVSCIYNIGSPEKYEHYVLKLKKGRKAAREVIIERLVDLQYAKNNYEFRRGVFRTRGDILDIFPAYSDKAVRIVTDNDFIQTIGELDPVSGKVEKKLEATVIYPAKHYMTVEDNFFSDVFGKIRRDLKKRVAQLQSEGKSLEARRLTQKVNYDLEMIQEVGYVSGIENYSRYFDGREPGEPPFTLLDYYRKPYDEDWLLFIDESHMTIPQIRGMYNGDRSRKQTLVDFGFRLPAALDNRPLTFSEFFKRIPQTIYVSATPSNWEISISKEEAERCSHRKNFTGVTQQLIRPTGILDPRIIIRPTSEQVLDLVKEIILRKEKGERVLVTTLTKRTAEDLASYLNDKKYLSSSKLSHVSSRDEYPKVHYLHSDVETLERSDILDDLRLGRYDVIIGINLLREGLDLPEVSLVAILDADKEGFLRSETSLIQSMGRAARHIAGTVILYADNVTNSIKNARAEITRRRNIQLEYNKKHNITPYNIVKPVRDKLIEREERPEDDFFSYLDKKTRVGYRKLLQIDASQLTPRGRARLIKKLEKEMKHAARELNFELAVEIRDRIKVLKEDIEI